MAGKTDLEVLEELVSRMEKPVNWLSGRDSHNRRRGADGGVCWCIGGHLGNAIEDDERAPFKRFLWNDSNAPEKLAAALVAEGQTRTVDVGGWNPDDDPHIEARAVIYAANEDQPHPVLLAACKRAVRDEKARIGVQVEVAPDPRRKALDLYLSGFDR